jgi:hypothetical protein
MSNATRAIAKERTGGLCACGCGGYGWSPHHVFPRQRWPELIDEPDNVIYLDPGCHANHESGSRRVPRSAIRCSEHLARTEPMKRYLDSVYGPL